MELLQLDLGRVPLGVRYHASKFAASPGILQPDDRGRARDQAGTGPGDARLHRRRQQVRFARNAADPSKRRARMGQATGIWLHGDECEGDGEH